MQLNGLNNKIRKYDAILGFYVAQSFAETWRLSPSTFTQEIIYFSLSSANDFCEVNHKEVLWRPTEKKTKDLETTPNKKQNSLDLPV